MLQFNNTTETKNIIMGDNMDGQEEPNFHH